jgi:hypothetical protein
VLVSHPSVLEYSGVGQLNELGWIDKKFGSLPIVNDTSLCWLPLRLLPCSVSLSLLSSALHTMVHVFPPALLEAVQRWCWHHSSHEFTDCSKERRISCAGAGCVLRIAFHSHVRCTLRRRTFFQICDWSLVALSYMSTKPPPRRTALRLRRVRFIA